MENANEAASVADSDADFVKGQDSRQAPGAPDLLVYQDITMHGLDYGQPEGDIALETFSSEMGDIDVDMDETALVSADKKGKGKARLECPEEPEYVMSEQVEEPAPDHFTSSELMGEQLPAQMVLYDHMIETMDVGSSSSASYVHSFFSILHSAKVIFAASR